MPHKEGFCGIKAAWGSGGDIMHRTPRREPLEASDGLGDGMVKLRTERFIDITNDRLGLLSVGQPLGQLFFDTHGVLLGSVVSWGLGVPAL